MIYMMLIAEAFIFFLSLHHSPDFSERCRPCRWASHTPHVRFGMPILEVQPRCGVMKNWENPWQPRVFIRKTREVFTFFLFGPTVTVKTRGFSYQPVEFSVEKRVLFHQGTVRFCGILNWTLGTSNQKTPTNINNIKNHPPVEKCFFSGQLMGFEAPLSVGILSELAPFFNGQVGKRGFGPFQVSQPLGRHPDFGSKKC